MKKKTIVSNKKLFDSITTKLGKRISDGYKVLSTELEKTTNIILIKIDSLIK